MRSASGEAKADGGGGMLRLVGDCELLVGDCELAVDVRKRVRLIDDTVLASRS